MIVTGLIIFGILGILTGVMPVTIRLITAHAEREYLRTVPKRVIPETHYAWED